MSAIPPDNNNLDPQPQSVDAQRKPKAPVLPCQSCLKRGLGPSCAYPDPDHPSHPPSTPSSAPPTSTTVDPSQTTFLSSAPAPAPPPSYSTPAPPANTHTTQYYDYNGAFTGASSSTFRPAKRPRNLTEEETNAITRGFQRGDFYVGSSAPVRIDPRLPVRLTLGEGDHVHFTVGEALV
ncbi:hypothetical protein BDZ89DRAFT_1171000 [Hymenopellis radicata]|nr:hypothetical protein BDZ89DRAFT_1171000 [Hymenopellis radicata]